MFGQALLREEEHAQICAEERPFRRVEPSQAPVPAGMEAAKEPDDESAHDVTLHERPSQ